MAENNKGLGPDLNTVQGTSAPDTTRVSSPAATGGAGPFFEQHVATYWLTQLLVRGIPPILHDCVVAEVHLQTEHLGWHTDDCLIVGENSSGQRRKLACQVKRTFTVSATDKECKKTIQDFWKDFTNPSHFSLAADRFALITLRGTNTLLEHFSALLDCARAASDGADFERRLATPGFVSAKAVRYCKDIRTVVSEDGGRNISAAEVCPFLRVLHVLSLDLNSSTRQTEAMAKTLLAHTTGEQDPIGAAETSWNALLREVGHEMPQARSFRREDLPAVLRQRHSLLGGAEPKALYALNGHSSVILSGIRSTIGGNLHLGRGGLVQQVLQQLESAQVVLISGAAGNGKSAVAKAAVTVLACDHFVFAFRAEEFAHAHFDETLQNSQIPANAATLGAILASQDRKVLLVESVERLLEKSTRDAFTDLLTLAARDASWRVVLTCRDYSADLVRASFLASASVGHSVITVPGLDDGELAEVERAYPTLARPLANPALRQVLRNPYVLDKALQISWSDERALPEREREFRELFWRDIIRADHRPAGGMPRRRQDAFVQIALRRARALKLYVVCDDLDPEVVQGLRQDSLIVSSQQGDVLMAPPHDVLEDWAILQWIDEQYATHSDSIRELSAAIGTHPAVRRTYRKWVGELVERDPGAADRLFQAAVREGALTLQFRDDTLVSLLRSTSSPEFLERHTAELFANDKQLLRRIIHLLRVACVTAPAWFKKTAAPASLFNVPDGPAWAGVLRLVQTHLASFTHEDRLLLLGLIEDWARGISWQDPYPDGAESTGAIAYWLLTTFDDYRSNEQRKRTLQVIAKIPNADRERFAAVLRSGGPDEARDRVSEDLRKIIFEGLDGMPVARDMPELTIAAANEYLLCSDASLRRGRGYTSDLGLETLFGIRPGRSQGFFPASAFRGPFLPLLRHHSGHGQELIVDVFNHSADWYARPRVGSRIEPPFEMSLTFTDGRSQTQLGNARLWNLYRGTSVGPYPLQSLLMALERWLFELAEARPDELDGVLLQFLQRSSSAAVTAVVASAATAFPHASGETLLVLLGSPLCIQLDRQRLATESQAPSRLSGIIPLMDPRSGIWESERKEADALPHRNRDLEAAIANLQLGPLAPRVHEILDRHRREMPPIEQQDEHDRLWRLALHRMDLRQYSVAEDGEVAPSVPDDPRAPDDNRQRIRLNLNEPDPDVKEMVDKTADRLQATSAKLGLLLWGRSVFGNEEDAAYDAARWRNRLEEARTADFRDGDEQEDQIGQGGPGFVAAVCVRDHWDEMADDERLWCIEVVCSEVERAADDWDQFARVQRYGMAGDRPCASVLPLLVGNRLDETSHARVRRAFVVALTHPVDEVRAYTAWGIGTHLWTIDRELTIHSVNALATEATLAQQLRDAEKRLPYSERRELDEIQARAARVVRQGFYEAESIPADACEALDVTHWLGAEANLRMLTILGKAPIEVAAIGAFERLAYTLVAWWEADRDHRRDRDAERYERDYQTEAALQELLENFVLRTTIENARRIVKPIVDAVDRHPDKVHLLLIGLIGVQDRYPNAAQFWSLWEQFAVAVRRAAWLPHIDDEHADGKEMISAIFLGTTWNERVRHWRSLEGYAHHLHSLFEGLPAASIVLDSYLRFLYHVGEQSLPESFLRIAKRLKQADPAQMMKEENTVFMLEVLLQRYVYARPRELKRQSDLREAVLVLLDLLVENGSSAAFRMRDDFVTPLSTT